MTRFVVLVLGFSGALAWAVPATAQVTVTLQQGKSGYSGVTDTYIDKFDAMSGNDFFGGVERIEVRNYNGGASEKMNILIKFDVSSLPSNATVTGAKLILFNIRANSQSADDIIVLEKVTGTWDNRSTWNMGVPSTVASGVTCPPVAPGYTDNPVVPEMYTITGLETLVQGWMASPASNNGMMLSCSSSNLNFRFASSEYPDPTTPATFSPYRPSLEVTYTTPNPPTVTVTSSPSTSTTTPITVSGTANATAPQTLAQVSWSNAQSFATGTATGTAAWTATIPLVTGNNTITITVTDSAGATGTTTFTVFYAPPPRTQKVGNQHKPCGNGAVDAPSWWTVLLGIAVLATILPPWRRRSAV